MASKVSSLLGMVIALSDNAKVGSVAATYAPTLQTCPETCALRSNGCYAETGHVKYTNDRLIRELAGLDGDTIAALEGAAIADMSSIVPEGRPLRIHVSGDCTTDKRARLVSGGAAAWRGPVWSYTHAWRSVSRASWGRVSVLASVESIPAAKQALARGYAPAIVTGPHPADGRAYDRDGIKVIPCPRQTRGVICTDCRLCWNDRALIERGAAIAFEVHGAGKKRALTVIQ